VRRPRRSVRRCDLIELVAEIGDDFVVRRFLLGAPARQIAKRRDCFAQIGHAVAVIDCSHHHVGGSILNERSFTTTAKKITGRAGAHTR
jgi:hypothetical protein